MIPVDYDSRHWKMNRVLIYYELGQLENGIVSLQKILKNGSK